MQKTTRIALLAAAALALPAAVHAQEGQPAPAPAPAPATPQAEMAQIQQRLAQLQQQAMQDSAVQAETQALAAVLQTAMERLDPVAREKTARSEALRAEVEAARAANDNAKLNQLAAEATELQTYFNGLRTRALAEEDVQAKRQQYLQVLFARMTEIDPEAQTLVQRLQALQSGTPAPAAPQQDHQH